MQAISTALPAVARTAALPLLGPSVTGDALAGKDGQSPILPRSLLSYATPAPPTDSVSLSSSVRAGGAIGTACGAAVGRLLLPTTGAVGVGALANLAMTAVLPALPAPIGIGLGAIAGLALGGFIESKTSAGRLVGGLTGSLIGTAAGGAVGVAGWRPSKPLADLSNHFSIGSLPRKLRDGDYFGYQSLRHDPAAVKALTDALPGDIVCVHHENVFEGAAFMTKLGGAKADYTHLGIVTNTGTIIDMVEGGAHERNKDAWLKFTHMAILRPRYANVDTLWNTVENARKAIKEKTYDDDLELNNDPSKEYCTEFVTNRLKENAPEIHLGTQKFLKKTFVTPDVFFASPDIDVVYDSGSNFWLNHLSRYC